MVQIVELCEKGDFAAARKLQGWLLPLITSTSARATRPVQGGDGGHGALRGELPAAARAGNCGRAAQKVMTVLQKLRLLGAAARV